LNPDYPRLYGAPLSSPEQAQALLRDPQLHWKKGRSAYELAHAWVGPGGTPKSVMGLFETAPEWRGATLIAGFVEHGTALDTMAGPSWTDLLAIMCVQDRLGVVAVEGKAGESFGPLIGDWNTTPGREARLRWACAMFGVDAGVANALRWQLFHRTASAVIEAKRFCAKQAMMLVHDFGAGVGLDDYRSFAAALGFSAGEDTLSNARTVEGVALRLGWLRDTPSA
jgi:Domain of unknown function (DUF6946)